MTLVWDSIQHNRPGKRLGFGGYRKAYRRRRSRPSMSGFSFRKCNADRLWLLP